MYSYFSPLNSGTSWMSCLNKNAMWGRPWPTEQDYWPSCSTRPSSMTPWPLTSAATKTDSHVNYQCSLKKLFVYICILFILYIWTVIHNKHNLHVSFSLYWLMLGMHWRFSEDSQFSSEIFPSNISSISNSELAFSACPISCRCVNILFTDFLIFPLK